MSKKKRKKAQKAARWATAQLPVLSHDTMECIVTQGLVGKHSAQQARKGLSHDTAGRITILPARARDTTPRCCDTAGQKHNTACDTGLQRARALSDTPATQPRHGQPQAATRPGHAHDTTPVRATTRRDTTIPARSLGHGCAHCALDPVLTHDTVLSHCLDHYS